MHTIVSQHITQIRALCVKHRVKSLCVFGSAANGGFSDATSDVDFLVDFQDQPRRGLDDVYFLLADDLEQLLGRPVDLVERQVVERSANPIRRESTHSSMVSLYAA